MDVQRNRGRAITVASPNRSLSNNLSKEKSNVTAGEQSITLNGKSPKFPKVLSLRSVSSSTTTATKQDIFKKTSILDMKSPTDRFYLRDSRSPLKYEAASSRNTLTDPDKFGLSSFEKLELNLENNDLTEEKREEGIHLQQIKQQTTKIQKLIGRAKGRISRFKSNTEKFDERLRVFSRLSTFLDSKQIYQEMNLLNSINPNKDYTQSFLNKINEQKNQKSGTESQNQLFPEKTQKLLEDARYRILYRNANNPLSTRRNQQYYELSKMAEQKLQRDYTFRCNTEETTDLNDFDDQLEKDIVHGKYDYMETVPTTIDDEEDQQKTELRHLKQLLEQGTRKRIVEDKSYAADFRARASKITKLLKQTAERIFHKKLTTVPPKKLKEALTSNPTAALTLIDNSNRRAASEKMEELHQELDYVSYSLSKEHFPAVFEKGKKRTNLMERTPFLLAKQQTKLLKQMGETVIENVENQKKEFREMKAMMSKKITQIEEFEEAELEKLKEDPEEALKIKFETNSHFATFASNPNKVRPTKKTFVYLFGK